MEVQKILREGLPAEIIALTGGMFAGLGLAMMLNAFQRVPGLIVMIPAFLDLRGDIASSLASRMGTALHSGIIEPRYKISDEIAQNIIGAWTLSTIEAGLIGILAYFVTILFGMHTSNLVVLFEIAVFASLLSSGLMIPVTVFSAIFFYKRGIDPDTVMSPYLATFGDVISISALIVAAQIVTGSL